MGVGMAITWEAVFEQWPWFAAAAGVLVVVIGLLILLKPKPKREPKTTSNTPDSKEWVLTGGIGDFVDPRSAGELVLQVEETRIVNQPKTALASRNSLAKGDIGRGKTVLVSSMPNESLLMSANFIVSAPTRAKQSANGQAETLDAELNDVTNGEREAKLNPKSPLNAVNPLIRQIAAKLNRRQRNQPLRSQFSGGKTSTFTITSFTNLALAGNRRNNSNRT